MRGRTGREGASNLRTLPQVVPQSTRLPQAYAEAAANA